MPRQRPTIAFGPDVDPDAEVVIVDGKRMTNADYEEWAEHLENRDRSNDRPAGNLIPGRKSLSGGSTHSPVINVRVSVDTRRKLQELSEASGESISKLARRAIDMFVES